MTNTPRTLRPRARLLQTLGQELISSEIVALIELVKNAYDADATRVLIRFVPPLEPERGRIEVIDNGLGMSLETVQTAWMEPATLLKRQTTRSPRFGRRHLGEKGIGRFASARLASDLEVISRREGAPTEVYAIFDWRQFDDPDRFLDEVEILWEERHPAELCPAGSLRALWSGEQSQPGDHDLQHGTMLRMSGVRQVWDAKQIGELTRTLARLVAPPHVQAEMPVEGDFQIRLDLPAEFSQFGQRVAPPLILQYPHYLVRGSIQADGTYTVTYKVLADDRVQAATGRYLRVREHGGNYEVRNIETSSRPVPTDSRDLACGPLQFELRVWDRDELGNVVQKSQSTISDLRRDLDSIAGVNLYRDGFRVLPYGEPQDDWLRLDLRRVQNPTLRLSNNQIQGTVLITADGNPALRDQSNREGLQDTQALSDLRDVLKDILGKLEQLRYASRPHSKGRRRPSGGLFAGFSLRPLAQHLARSAPHDKEGQDLLKSTEKEFEIQLREIQTVLARYQRLATLGQLIDHVLHEGRQPVASINNEAYLGIQDIQRLSEAPPDTTIGRLSARFSLIRNQGAVLATAFKRMEPFGGRRRGRPTQLYLEDIIRDAFVVFERELVDLGVKKSLPATQTLVRVDAAEIQEVIINLLQNSLYWLEQTDAAHREISVTVERKGPDQLELLFSDSGPGVPAEYRSLIFEPYFSMKAEGVGLGLTIAGEIVTDYYGGSLELLDSGPLDGATFLVTLRKRV